MKTVQPKLLEAAAELFARHGYAGVSMRQIARETGITQAAIYHHFANKDELYLACLEHLYAGQSDALVSLVASEQVREKRLQLVVAQLLQIFDEPALFRQIYFRELLDGDEQRLKMLSDRVFPEIEELLGELMIELAPKLDPELMMLSLTGLVFHHLEARKVYPLMKGAHAEHQELDVLADHITTLLLNGVRGE